MNNDLKQILRDLRRGKQNPVGINLQLDENGAMRLRGQDGYTPQKGIDYWTPEELDEIVTTIFKAAKPEYGVDYYTEADKRKFVAEVLKLATPVKGRDYRDGIDGKDGRDGKDAEPLDPRQVAIDAINFLETFEGDARLSAKALKDLDEAVTDILKRGADFELSEKQISTIKDLLPKYPPMNAGGSGATFLKSLRDVDLSGLTKNADGKYVLGGGSGASTFLGLTDTPASYSGQGGKLVAVKGAEDGVEFIALPSGSGDVIGPASSTDNHIALFSGVTGKIIKDSGVTTAAFAAASHAHAISDVTGLQTALDGKGVGNVTKVGTPVDNQVGVWTGDGTIEGSDNLTFTDDILTVTNNENTGAATALVVQGDRVTPTANDEVIIELKLSDSAGNQDTMATIRAQALDVTSGSEDSQLKFGTVVAGTLASRVAITGTTIQPNTDDTIALGNATANRWSDLYLAPGGVINFNNGNATLTHSTGLLTSNVDIVVPDEAYDATTWNASLEVPTKNAVRDKIDTMDTTIAGKQDKVVVVSGSLTASNDTYYHNVASATYTDPSPVEGKGFTVFVRNGTATVGGTGYSTVGTIIVRTFHSGSWANAVYFTGSTLVSDTAYGAGWNGVTTVAPSQNAVYDEMELRAPKASPTLTGTTTVTELDYTRADGVVSALGNLGATETIDWSTATHFTGTLDSNVNITHSNEVSGRKITLYLSYSGAQRTITWTDVDVWLDNATGAAPAAPAASGNVLIVTMQYIGTTCYASATGNYAAYS